MTDSPELASLVLSRTIDVPDFPKPGIVFKDLMPLFADGPAFRKMIDGIVDHYGADAFDVVAGVEARGFVVAAAVAYATGTGVVPVRKAGKLPRERVAADYTLEYGTATLELHADSISPGDRVLVVDDVLATGGTLEAAIALVERLGGVVEAVSVVIELAALGGRQRIAPHAVHALWTT